MKKSAEFYARNFGFITTGEVNEGLIELRAPHAGAGLFIHLAVAVTTLVFALIGTAIGFFFRRKEP